METKSGDSSYQLELQYILQIKVQSDHPEWTMLNWHDTIGELGLPPVWGKAIPDAIWQDEKQNYVIAECTVHIGKLKPGQRRKLALDTFKLISIKNASVIPDRIRLLLIIPEDINRVLKNSGWLYEAINKSVEITSIEMNDEQRQKLQSVINRQADNQARMAKQNKANY